MEIIEQTYKVVLPSGRKAEVNCFDMNLAMACGGEQYIHLEDTSWIQAKRLRVVNKPTSYKGVSNERL